MNSERAQDDGVTLTAAATQGCGTDTAATTAQLVQHRECQAIAAHADRVAERNRTTVDIDDVHADPELARRCDTDRGEGIVELEQVSFSF